MTGREIPEGRSCGDCMSFKRCRWLFGCDLDSTECDWDPPRYRPRIRKLDPADDARNEDNYRVAA